mgnify:CR=1 FL=1
MAVAVVWMELLVHAVVEDVHIMEGSQVGIFALKVTVTNLMYYPL